MKDGPKKVAEPLTMNLDPKDALRAFMEVDPEKVLEAERHEREKRDKENGDADSER